MELIFPVGNFPGVGRNTRKPAMKTILILSISLLPLSPVRAQNPGATVAAGARTNTAARRETSALVSPEVHLDRTVTFRARTTNAHDVKVTGNWKNGTSALTNDGNGVWSITVGPLDPEIYDYSLIVDGFTTVDTANPWVKPMRATRTSLVEVPSDPPRLWEFQNVPHGTVHVHSYLSKSLGMKRRLHVYTPPGYEKRPRSLPVLYLFHGAGDSDATWTASGRAHLIADNLIAQGKAAPMILVMPDGHAYTGNPTQVSSNVIARNVEAFREDLLKDVMPLIESMYRVKANRENRAIIGLSMGGGQSLSIGLRNHDLFAWVGGMSSYLPNSEQVVAEVFPESKSDLRLLWIACGKDDFLIDGARKLSAALKAKGIPYEFNESEGAHTWPVWRSYLGEFMPLIFETKKAAVSSASNR
jgi:enterochelin esterase family protein